MRRKAAPPPGRPLVLVFGESEHDSRAIKALVAGLAPGLSHCVEHRRQPLVLIKKALPKKARSNAEKIADLARIEGRVRRVLAVLAHEDCDALEPEHLVVADRIESELRSAGCPNPIAVTPAWEIDAWWRGSAVARRGCSCGMSCAMKRLLGKFAIVTGGSSGIGAACAEALAAEGAAVVATGRRFPGGPVRVPGLGEVSRAHLDVTDEAEVAARIAELPELDILVCSAGVGVFGPLIHARPADLRAMLDVHVVGTMLCAREALRRMQPRRTGHIVAIGSHAAHRAFTDCSGYTAAKAGQLGLVKVLAEEARPYGVRVTALLPGATDTPIWDDRPGFDRSKMMQPADVASFLIAIVGRPGIAVEEVIVMPPAGAL